MQQMSTKTATSDMNVTPLIDVVLVLLIIFMVITPIILQQSQIHLPKMEVTDEPPDPTQPGAIVVKLGADSSVALRVGDAEEPVTMTVLEEKLAKQLSVRTDKTVFVDASTLVSYGQAVTIFDLVSGTGAKVALVETDDDPEQDSGASASP